jgi:YD repeat-containing protein
LTNQAAQTVSGSVSEAATLILRLNGTAVQTLALSSTNAFTSAPVTLAEGSNRLEVVALDAAGNSGTASRTVTLDTIPPAAVAATALSVGPVTTGQVTVSGSAGSVEAGAQVTITNTRTGVAVTVVAAADGRFTVAIAAEAGDQLAITSADGAGNTSGTTDVPVGGGLPPDPATMAPALDRTVATDHASATAFLYTGPNPIQTGVAPGTIEPKRAAVLRGAVKTRDGLSLPGVTLTVLNHPEYGQTLSRADGAFDLAVNGGGVLTVQYEKAGFLPVQRQVQAPWQDFAWLPEVVLVPLDSQVTVVDLTAPTMQMAQGSAVTDADGSRRATVLVPPGTTATLVRPDGTTQALSTLSVRATEYTVGASGPQAMPAPLPPTSGYTYAVELSADEALAAGATTVRFSQPMIQYVENFLNFPVGGIVPVGFYERDTATWVPSKNGRVIKLLGITGGLADLDVDGSGVAAAAAALAALGVTDAERQRLATLYAAGQSLWRVPISHFTPWDYNWPFGPPADAVAPQQPDPELGEPLDKPTCRAGSIIECQNQILGEVLTLTGTPFRLHYQSDRVLGRKAANTLNIPVTGPSVPASLTRIELQVSVAGRRVTAALAPLPNQTHTFTWDGRDAYGRPLQGDQPVSIRIGYVYQPVYQQPAQFEASFGAVSGAPIKSNPARGEMTIWQDITGTVYTVGGWDARAQGLAAWTLNVHHAYDPVGQVLYLGDGRRRSGEDVKRVITTVAGVATGGFSGDGGPATQARFFNPRGVAVAADGSAYIADWGNHRVRRVGPDGVITTVAGSSSVEGFGGDGGPATQARLNAPTDVELAPDGSYAIADFRNFRIRRVTRDGIITTVAGTGLQGFSGDGGPATQARLNFAADIALAPDGTLYIADSLNHRIRRVGPDGIITTVAGTGVAGFSGDGGPAAGAQLSRPGGVALGADGSLYIADTSNRRIRRVGTNGVMTTVAGTGVFGSGGDGGPASQASLGFPSRLAVGPDGSVYVSDSNRVRRITAEGVITALAGTGVAGFGGDGGAATQAVLFQSDGGLAVAPDGSVYITDAINNRIRPVGPPLPGFDSRDIAVPAEDGTELYVFNANGRHLRTLDALTSAVRSEFAYDPAGRLVQIKDRSGLVTTIERDVAGQPTALVAPGGQRTSLSVDPNGYLASLTNPAGETTGFGYTPDGLLLTLTDPKGQITQFTYDGLGRLTRDADPAGGVSALARTGTRADYTVTLTTALNRATRHRVEQLPTGATRQTTIEPSGVQTVVQIGTDGSRTTTAPDGTVTTLVPGPDPRFGMQAPLRKSLTVRTPAGLQSTLTEARAVTLAGTSLSTLTDTIALNGRTSTRIFDAALKTITDQTPAGRQTVRTLDAQGRVVEVQAAGREPTSFAYDLRGRLTTVTQSSGPTARTSTFGYDLQDRLVSLTDPLGRTVGFAYDLADRVTTQTLPDGRQIGFLYDATGNVTSVTPPGRPAHGFGYTPVNLEASYTPPALDATSPTTTSAYNADRQPTLITRPDGQALSFGYDAGGQLSTLTVPTGIFRFAYHATTGQLATLTAPDGGTLAYTYDGALVTSESWGGPLGAVAGSVSRTYDSDFRVASESVNGANPITFAYDPDSLLTQAGAVSLTRDVQTGFLVGTTLGSLTDALTYSTFG